MLKRRLRITFYNLENNLISCQRIEIIITIKKHLIVHSKIFDTRYSNPFIVLIGVKNE
jgi:hypothetical protein